MSDLLNKASLVMVPSGYKEDTVYSVVPTDGSGDLTFTRASNGTRVNSAGLVEVVPWNAIQYSEDFTNAVWSIPNGGSSVIVTSNATTAPNGTTTADKIEIANGTNDRIEQVSTAPILTSGLPCTFSVYIKSISGTGKVGIRSGQSGASSVLSYTNEWQRLTWTFNALGTYEIPQFCNSTLVGGADSAPSFFVWGAQLNIGSTAKPYFPTTDRLNVPRLTYQNGGGGCPSLLLEKQSTNLVSYSNGFDNSYWDKTSQGVGSNAVVTPNYTTSPDGTNNAFRFQCNLNGGTTTNDRSWMVGIFTAQATSTISIYIKLNSAGTKTIVFSDGGGDLKTISNTEWQRIDGTFSGASGQFRIGLIGGLGASDTLDCSIAFAQAEASSYATSYIPTTSSSATRVADACYKTGISSLIGQTEGVVFWDGVIDNFANYGTCVAIDGTNNSWIYLITYSLGFSIEMRSNGTVAASYSPTNSAGRYKIAMAYNSSQFVVYINGSLVHTDNSVTVPATSAIYLSDFFSYNQLVKTNQVALFKTRLTNAELASLTTI